MFFVEYYDYLHRTVRLAADNGIADETYCRTIINKNPNILWFIAPIYNWNHRFSAWHSTKSILFFHLFFTSRIPTLLEVITATIFFLQNRTIEGWFLQNRTSLLLSE